MCGCTVSQTSMILRTSIWYEATLLGKCELWRGTLVASNMAIPNQPLGDFRWIPEANQRHRLIKVDIAWWICWCNDMQRFFTVDGPAKSCTSWELWVTIVPTFITNSQLVITQSITNWYLGTPLSYPAPVGAKKGVWSTACPSTNWWFRNHPSMGYLWLIARRIARRRRRCPHHGGPTEIARE